MDEINKIKEMLYVMPSADIELVINIASRQLRKAALKEAHQLLIMATDPKVKKILKDYEK